jgi:colanic acid/amylovoran biosynthesis protein
MMSKQPRVKVLVVNLHSSRNAGDAALLQATIYQLRQAFARAEITLAVNDMHSRIREDKDTEIIPSFMASFGPSQASDQRSDWRLGRMTYVLGLSLVFGLWYRATRQVPAWIPETIRQRLLAYSEADLVVSCPGNIFFTMGRWGLPFIISAFTVGYALLLKKPLYVMPQSVGPLKRWWERLLVRSLYSRARLVFMREPVSFRLIRELGVAGPHVRLVPDMAFSFPSAGTEQQPDMNFDSASLEDVSPKLGVTVINRIVYSLSNDSWERYAESVAGALSGFLDAYGGDVFFYPQVIGPTSSEDDRGMAQYVISKMADDSHVRLVDVPTSPVLLKTLYGQMDLFIATRLHSAIFATTMLVPTVFIGYLHKTQGIVEMLEMEEWILDIREVTEDALLGKIKKLWLHREHIQEKLKRTVPRLQEESTGVGKAIAEDYWHYEHQER